MKKERKIVIDRDDSLTEGEEVVFWIVIIALLAGITLIIGVNS